MRQVNIRGLDLNLLVPLDCLLQHRNVTRAAQAANMSQPAMSRALGRLRAMLGDPILVRGSEGLVATPRALALQPSLKKLLTEIGAMVAAEEFDPGRWVGKVRIAASDHQTILLLPPIMARLSRDAPGLDMTVVPFFPEVLGALRDGRIDLAFGVAEQVLTAGTYAEMLYNDRFVTLLRRGHPAIDQWSLETFASAAHVLVTVLGDGRGVLDDALERLGFTRRVALALPHFYAAMAVVAQSDLVVTLPLSLASLYLEHFGLQALDLPFSRAPITHTLIWPERLNQDAASKWLRTLIREEVAASRVGLEVDLPR